LSSWHSEQAGFFSFAWWQDVPDVRWHNQPHEKKGRREVPLFLDPRGRLASVV
jgi:hypothetical protein